MVIAVEKEEAAVVDLYKVIDVLGDMEKRRNLLK